MRTIIPNSRSHRDRSNIITFLTKRDGPNCQLCGLPFPDNEKEKRKGHWKITIDHIVSKANGGHPRARRNLQLVHGSCNTLKSVLEHPTQAIPIQVGRLWLGPKPKRVVYEPLRYKVTMGRPLPKSVEIWLTQVE